MSGVDVRQLCIEKNLTANEIPGASLAAAVIQLGEHLVTSRVAITKNLGE